MSNAIVDAASIRKVLVVGTGTMGQGIAQVTALAGYVTHLYDVDADRVNKAIDAIKAQTDRLVQKGKMLNEAQSSTNLSTRCGYYQQAQEYIAKNYYGPFYFSLNPTNVSTHGMGGPGLTSSLPAVAVGPTLPWESIWDNPSS